MIAYKFSDARGFIIDTLAVQPLKHSYYARNFVGTTEYWVNNTTREFTSGVFFFPAEPDFIINDTQAVGRNFTSLVLLLPLSGETIRVTSRWVSGNVYIVRFSFSIGVAL